MYNKVAIIGYGNFGKQFHNFIKENTINSFVFFDDIAFKRNEENCLPFDSNNLPKYQNYSFYVALGYHHLQTKIKVIQHLISLDRIIPVFKHTTCFVNRSANLGHGTFIYPMCNIDSNVEIGIGVLINNSVCISHDSIIGDGCYISPGVIVSGKVTIGDYTFIGAGSIIANDIKIGKNVIIGIGSVVTRDLPDNCSAIGNPLRILNKAIELQ
jgi:sugar O-acyltransferase (sialic acid O-acetyltransferase NeuD family)